MARLRAGCPQSHPLAFLPSLKAVKREGSDGSLVLLPTTEPRPVAHRTQIVNMSNSRQETLSLLVTTAVSARVKAWLHAWRGAAGTWRRVGVWGRLDVLKARQRQIGHLHWGQQGQRQQDLLDGKLDAPRTSPL